MNVTTDSTIHVAIAFDQHYLEPFYALVASIVKHHHSNQIHIHTIASGINDPERSRIKEYITSQGSNITFYEIDTLLVKEFVLLNSWTSAVYYRLYFPLIIPKQITRLLYLDTDTLVIHNLGELYNTDLEAYPVGAVYDNYVKAQPLIGIHEEGNYFNSGVMVIDTQKWREKNISELAMDYLKKYPDRILFVDQCGLNAVLKNNWKKLPGKYNLMYSLIPEALGKSALNDFIKDKVVIHFTLERPWNMLCKNRLRHLYYKYLQLSPAVTSRTYKDFSFGKLPGWLKVRIIELYFDYTFLQRIWRNIRV
jgi:lipopolysaccharide biosynthesis glycosyltransferase